MGDIGVVVEVDRGTGTVRIESAGRPRTASSALVTDLAIGDRVLVHTGFVLERLDPEPNQTRGIDA